MCLFFKCKEFYNIAMREMVVSVVNAIDAIGSVAALCATDARRTNCSRTRDNLL
jgi:hypothetical protein